MAILAVNRVCFVYAEIIKDGTLGIYSRSPEQARMSEYFRKRNQMESAASFGR